LGSGAVTGDGVVLAMATSVERDIKWHYMPGTGNVPNFKLNPCLIKFVYVHQTK
jgi:hypothetical protein